MDSRQRSLGEWEAELSLEDGLAQLPQTDLYTVGFVQLALTLFALFAAVKDAQIRVLERSAEAKVVMKLVVKRGGESMTALYTVYGAAIASCLMLIDNAVGLEGHKVALIALDVLCITYIFFFSTWFRNSVFFPLKRRVSKD